MDGVAARMFLRLRKPFFLRILENTRRGEVFRLWLGRLCAATCCVIMLIFHVEVFLCRYESEKFQ